MTEAGGPNEFSEPVPDVTPLRARFAPGSAVTSAALPGLRIAAADILD